MEEGKEVLPAGNCQQKADNAEDDEASNSWWDKMSPFFFKYLLAASGLSQNDQMEPSRFYMESVNNSIKRMTI